jgi:hypothetical protein
MYTNVDLLFSLLWLGVWLTLICVSIKAIIRAFKDTPLALILGGMLTLQLMSGTIPTAVGPINSYFNVLLSNGIFSVIEFQSLSDLTLSVAHWKNGLLYLIVFASLTWFSQGLVRFFRRVIPDDSELSKKKSGDNTPNNYSSPLIQNTVTILIIIFAFYLSLASLITLPVITSGIANNQAVSENFQNIDPGQLKSELVEKLDQDIEQLRSMNYDTTEWVQIYTKSDGNEDTVIVKEARPFYLSRLDSYESIYISEDGSSNIIDPIQDLLFAEYKYLEVAIWEIDTTWLSLDKAKAIASLRQAEERNLKYSSKLAYKAELYDWFARQNNLYWSEIKERIVLLNEFYNDVKDQSEHKHYSGFANEYLQKKEQLEREFTNIDFPALPMQGDHLGSFVRFFINWLLQIESYSLVVVVGLIGFGLLGSISAGFVKEHRSRPKSHGVLVPELTKALIAGFSAALVVYLGVRGSVSLLSGNISSTGNNGYLLYFLALMAAIYSDTAWEWARKRFESSLSEN